MTPDLSIHTAARRYCMEQYTHWCQKYAEIVEAGRDRDGGDYTQEALATFPRYNAVWAILVDIERLDPEDLPDSEELKELILLSGQTAETLLTEKPISETDAQAMTDTRDDFCMFIESLTAADLAAIKPLPYRRVLNKVEETKYRDDLKIQWHVDGYWYPLTDCDNASLTAYKAYDFHAALPSSALRELMSSRQINRLFELREYGPENYLLDLHAWDPNYNGAEGFWFSDKMDWILYASHEDSITTGGWLTDAVKAAWPDSESHYWEPWGRK